MPHFVYDDTALFFPKTNLNPLPPGADPTQYVQSLDWNTLNQAVEDIKTLLRGAIYYGVEKQAVDPAPAGIADYLWADTGGDLFFHTGGSDILLTPSAATVTGGSNVGSGAGSVGPFKQVTGGVMEFKGIRPVSTKLSVLDAVGTDDIDIDVVEANIIHQNLSGIGSVTHAQIDAQIPSTVQKTDLGQLDGAAQGTVWYASGTGRVTRLAPGTAGHFLQTQGAGADPVWALGSLAIQDEGAPVTSTPHTTMNFVGAGVTAANAGGGVVTVTFSGITAANTLEQAYNEGGAGLGRVINAIDGAVVIQNSDIETDNVLEVIKTPGGLTTGHALFVSATDSLNDYAVRIQHSTLAATSPLSGLVLDNPTAATLGGGNEEYSPLLALRGGAHDDTDPRSWTWALQNRPVNVTAADTAALHFLVSDNGGAFATVMNLGETGILSIADELRTTGVTRDSADLTISTTTSGNILLNSAANILVTATNLDLATSVSALDLLGGTALSIDGVALTTGLTAALLSEAMLFFSNTDLSGAEAETLSDGSNADALHEHAALTADSAPVVISTTTSGDIQLTSAGDIDFTATDVDLATSVSTLNLLGGTALSINGVALTTGLTAALLSESMLFFTNTDLTGAEAEILSDGSNADALHEHAALVADSANISITTTTSGDVDITAASNVDITGTAIGIFGATAVSQQASGADLTNNVTSGGTNDQIDDFTDLTTYSNDAAAIRNAIYQLARKLKQVNDGLRAYGWLS